jgi:hypothetical protein
MRVNFGVHLSACRQPGLSDTPDDPGTYLLYTISGVSTQYLSKKRPACGSGSSLKGTNKKQQKQQKQQKALAWLLRNCSTSNISLNSVFVNVLYPPHEHIFAKGVFHGIYPSSN